MDTFETYQAPDKALPFSGKEVRRPLPLAGREAFSRRILVLPGMIRLRREGTSPCQEVDGYGRRLRTSPESQSG
jgi:hypothetical protein